MRVIAVLLGVLCCTGQGRRVPSVQAQTHPSSSESKDLSRKVTDALSNNASMVELKRSQSKLRVGMPHALKALAFLLLAFNPTSGLQATGHGGRYSVNRPGGAIGSLNGSRHASPPLWNMQQLAAQRAHVRMAGDSFETSLSRLASSEYLPRVRKRLRELESLIGNFGGEARLSEVIRDVHSSDPTSVSSTLSTALQEAVKGGRYKEAHEFRDRLRTLKRFQPEYQLAGMWKAEQPEWNDESVPVQFSYEGDFLIATNGYGDLVFTADVSESKLDGMYEKDNNLHDVLHFEGESLIEGNDATEIVPGQMYLMGDDIIAWLWLTGEREDDDDDDDAELSTAAGRGRGGAEPYDGPPFVLFTRDVKNNKPQFLSASAASAEDNGPLAQATTAVAAAAADASAAAASAALNQFIKMQDSAD